MNSIITEVFAAILILISIVKIMMIKLNPTAWLDFVKRIYSYPKAVSAICLVLAGIVLFLLLQSGLDIVQILAVCLFLALIIIIGMVPFMPYWSDWFETIDINQLLKAQWLYISIWIALLIWGAYKILSA
jgi:hypothetical protein